MVTDIHLAFGHVYLGPADVLEFLNGCVGLNYSGIFFLPLSVDFWLKIF